MGLDCSHDAWHGAYSAFNRFRQSVAKACGGSFPPHDPGYADVDDLGRVILGDQWYYETSVVPGCHLAGMTAFLGHSDCDGVLTPAECVQVAAFLRWAACRIPTTPVSAATLHITWRPRDAAIRFAEGCEAAAQAGEDLEFG